VGLNLSIYDATHTPSFADGNIFDVFGKPVWSKGGDWGHLTSIDKSMPTNTQHNTMSKREWQEGASSSNRGVKKRR